MQEARLRLASRINIWILFMRGFYFGNIKSTASKVLTTQKSLLGISSDVVLNKIETSGSNE
jgi:hypothetical protein